MNQYHKNKTELQAITTHTFSIVIIEDDHDDRELLIDAFREIIPSAHVVCFPDTAKALQYLNALKEGTVPSLFVLDYNLPLITGLQFLKHLSEDVRFSSTAKVVYSHSSNPKDKENCLAAGANAYIEKGCSFAQMRDDALQMLAFCNRSN